MRDRGDFAMGLLVGGLVGALVGLLLAPTSGEETRRIIGQRATETSGRVRVGALEIADKVREGASTVSEQAARSAQEFTRQVRSQVSGLVDGVGQVVGDTLRATDESGSTAAGLGEAAAAVEGQGGVG